MIDKEMKELIAYYHDLHEELEIRGAVKTAAALYEEKFLFFRYDRNGNYIDAVANENGWTA